MACGFMVRRFQGGIAGRIKPAYDSEDPQMKNCCPILALSGAGARLPAAQAGRAHRLGLNDYLFQPTRIKRV